MRFSNGILVIALSVGTLTFPGLAGVKTPVVGKSECAKPATTGTCAAKLTGDPAGKAKNLKPLPVTTRAAHPRR
jgi:hypothetical protein